MRSFNGTPPTEAPDSAIFLSDSNLGVGENNPRAGKLMQHLGGKWSCCLGQNHGRHAT